MQSRLASDQLRELAGPRLGYASSHGGCSLHCAGNFLAGSRTTERIESGARFANAAKKLLRSISAFEAVCRSKILMSLGHHTPAAFLPRSSGDMRSEGTGCAEGSAVDPPSYFGGTRKAGTPRPGVGRAGGGGGVA